MFAYDLSANLSRSIGLTHPSAFSVVFASLRLRRTRFRMALVDRRASVMQVWISSPELLSGFGYFAVSPVFHNLSGHPDFTIRHSSGRLAGLLLNQLRQAEVGG
jgi:hypothetical protein